MVDKPLPTDITPAGVDAAQSPAQSPRATGGRGPDARDAVAELAERAQLISQEAGSKVAAAMKDVISAAAGIAGFAIESARDLVQFMVRRGQMTQDEADKLIRQAEAAHERRPANEKARPTATKLAADRAAAAKADAARAASAAAMAAPHDAHANHEHRGSAAHAPTTAPRQSPAPAAKPPAVKVNGASRAAKTGKPAAKAGASTKGAKPTRPAKAAKPAKPTAKSARAASPSAKASAKPSVKHAAKKSASSRKR